MLYDFLSNNILVTRHAFTFDQIKFPIKFPIMFSVVEGQGTIKLKCALIFLEFTLVWCLFLVIGTLKMSTSYKLGCSQIKATKAELNLASYSENTTVSLFTLTIGELRRGH